MNAPFVVAQAIAAGEAATSGQDAPPAPPRVLKLEKPQGEQALVIHMDGATQLDFTAIQGEQITLVRAGERLVILFDNRSTISIDPFFDAGGFPLKIGAIELEGNRLMTGEEFASIFPIGNDQSILPAAAQGPQGSSGPFGAYSVDGLSEIAPIALLGNEENATAFDFTLIRTPLDGLVSAPAAGGVTPPPVGPIVAPTAGSFTLALDEDGLPSGNPGGSGDVMLLSPENVASGTLPHSFGNGGAGSISFVAMDGTNQTIGGVQYDFAWDAVTGILTVSTGGAAVIEVVLDPATGAFMATLVGALTHTVAGAEDDLPFNLTYTVTSPTGSTTGTLSLNVNDDLPEIGGPFENGAQRDFTLDEDDLASGNDGRFPDTNQHDQTTLADKPLGISWGADDGAARDLQFTTTSAPSGLTSHHADVNYFVSADGHTLIAYTDANANDAAAQVFKVTLDPTAPGGAYTFQLLGSLDHAKGEGENSLALTFDFTATDSDGDPVSSSFTIRVVDDIPTVALDLSENKLLFDESPLAQSSDADDVSGVLANIVAALFSAALVPNRGNDPDTLGLPLGFARSTGAMVTVDAHYGADGEGAAPVYSFELGGVDSGLKTTKGEPIFLYLQDNGVVVGRVGGANGDAAFALHINAQTGVVSLAEWLSIQHDDKVDSNDIMSLAKGALLVKVTVTDGDGDTASTTTDISGRVSFRDDGPSLIGQLHRTHNVDEGDIATGLSIGTSPHDGRGDGSVTGGPTDKTVGPAYVGGSLAAFVLFGVDGQAAGGGFGFTQDAAQTMNALGLQSDQVALAWQLNGNVLEGAAGGRTVIVFTLNPDGSYSYQQFDQLDHVAPAQGTSDHNTQLVGAAGGIDFGSVIKATDGDGDSISLAGRLSITVVDDIPIAKADSGNVTEGALLSVDAAGGLLANDMMGADGATIVGVRAAGGNTTTPVTDGVLVVETALGKLTILADGSYTYQSKPDAITAATQDVFVYTLRDGDGDLSTTTLTIDLGNVTLVADDQSKTVNEAALDKQKDGDDLAAGTVEGSDPASAAETVTGQLNVTGAVSYASTSVGNHGEFHLNSDGNWTYTLTSPVKGPTNDDDANTVTGAEVFDYTATDANGNTVHGTITIDIVDDTPKASDVVAANVLDDESLVSPYAHGNDGGPGDDGNSTTFSGSLAFNAGADGLKQIDVSETLQVYNSNNALLSGPLKAIYVDEHGIGHQRDVQIAWVQNGVGGTLTGTALDLDNNPFTVFTLTVNANGTYTLTMAAPLVHPFTDADGKNDGAETSWEDNLRLVFDYTVTDGDGDTAHATLSVNVDDDSPMPGQAVSGSVKEADIAVQPGDLPVTTFNFSGTVANTSIASYLGPNLTANGSTLGTGYGSAFGLNAPIVISATDNSHPFMLEQLNIGVTGPNQAMTVWLYGYDSSGALIAKQSFTVSGPTSLGDPLTSPESLFVAGTGALGFAGKEIVRLEIESPTFGSQVQIDNLAVGMGDALPGDITPAHVEIDLGLAALLGADGANADATFLIKTVAAGDPFGSLQSDGKQVLVATENGKLIGYTGNTDDPAFTLEIVNGQAVFKLFHQLDHTGQQDLTLNFGPYILAVDGDGDATALTSVTVTVVGDAPPAVVEAPTINSVNPGIYYAFTKDSLAPNDISFDAHNLFSSSNPMTFQYTLVAGSASWLTVTNGAAGTVTANDVSGTGPSTATGATIFRVEATDTVTHLTSFTYIAFTALGGTTWGASGFDQNAQGNLYDGNGFLSSGNNGNVYIAAPGGSAINAGNFADAIYGSDNADTINAQSANNGANYINAGGGDDIVNGGNHMDVILGGGGNDTIHGGDGNDIILGEDGGDILYGDNGNDLIYGGAGNDQIFGGEHDDILIGGSGSDILTGGSGKDTFRYLAGDLDGGGVDTIMDFQTGTGSNSDILDLSGLLDGYAGNKDAHVRFVDIDGHTRLASDTNTPVLVDGDIKVQVETGSGTWTDVAIIKDTGGNLTAGADVLQMMLDHTQVQQVAV